MSRKENSNRSFLLNSSPANLGSLHKEVETNMRNGKDQHCLDDEGGSTSVSFMLEEPRSSLKEGFNIEVIIHLFEVNYLCVVITIECDLKYKKGALFTRCVSSSNSNSWTWIRKRWPKV